MTKITPDIVKSLITKEGRLYVPESIANAVASCIVSDVNDIRAEGERLKTLYDSLSRKAEPIVVDYSGDLTIDAYSVYYLPRNTLVPKIAILCCAYNVAFQRLPKRLRVLDIGSGTGGVVLGLLDLFCSNVLSGTCLDLVALDWSYSSLERQKRLVGRMDIRQSSHRCHAVDLSDPKEYEDKLSAGAPYDMVFAANLFAELDQPASDALLEHIAPLLSENGIIVNVESQSNYAKKQKARIAKIAKEVGLHLYYPCPPDLTCPRQDCWKWRIDEFECPDIMVDGEALDPTKIQIAHWMILCKSSCSIYDTFHDKNPQLVWGVAASGRVQTEDDKIKYDYEFCTESGWRRGTITRKKGLLRLMEGEPFKRGNIVGITRDFEEIKEGWDIIAGFGSY